jgi:prepilin-type N-terminal cleavage/methylation domain-containing protein
MKEKNGFTLVEIMTVMFIVVVLAAMVVVGVPTLQRVANEAICQANLRSISSAFEVYAARHNGLYATGNETNLEFLVTGGYLSHDLVSLGQIGNYRYEAYFIGPAGYDIRAISVNPVLGGQNYRITTGGTLSRLD